MKSGGRMGKGPSEIFGSRVFFTQIRPVWVGDVGTRPKNLKLGWFRLENRQFILDGQQSPLRTHHGDFFKGRETL
jgi:hypothetical protein